MPLTAPVGPRLDHALLTRHPRASQNPAVAARRNRPLLGAALGAGVAAGCAPAATLLEPAHVLGDGRTAAGAGVAGGLPLGRSGPEDERLRIAQEHEAPYGTSPWLALRRGLGGGAEGSLVLDGRALRAGYRRATGGESLAWSLGVGVQGDLPPLESLPVRGQRFGLDAPLVLGWRSAGGVAQAWSGLRAGVNLGAGSLEGAEGAVALQTRQLWGSWSLGLAVGVRPVQVHLGLESVLAHSSVTTRTGGVERADARLSLVLRPAAALVGTF